MSGLALRPARQEDSAFLARLCREALGYDASPEALAERLCRLNRQPEHTILLAEWNGCPAGFIHTHRYEVLYAPAMMNVLGLAVSPEYRRNGIGRALLRAVEQDALARGIGTVRLASGAERTQAHRFYQSCGYLPRKQQLKFYKPLVPAGDLAGPSALRREV